VRQNAGVAESVPEHILVLCENSRRGARALQRAAAEAEQTNARLTVVTVVVTEPENVGCCDTRAVYWNGVVRDLAAEDLDRARSLLGAGTAAEFKVLTGRSVLAALALEAQRSGADMVVLPSGRGIHPWFRTRRARRLQRRTAGSIVVAGAGRERQTV
jgi:nucleotide-binding universal stress UspA family protein